MTKILGAIVCLLAASVSYSGEVRGVAPTAVGRTKKVAIAVDFDRAIKSRPDSTKFSLVSSGNERVFCTEVVVRDMRMRFVFQINSANFVAFERLVSDSSGYFLQNEEPIVFDGDTLQAGELEDHTKNKIRKIAESDWKKYIIDEYAARYLFPHEFKVGTQLGLEDSTKTVYFLELVQSGNWTHVGDLSIFWGLKGRWSTDRDDKSNYAQFYPFTLLYTKGGQRLALSTGVETGYRGFGKEGRGTFKGEFQFRLPFNPIDLTLGNPRWRLDPVCNFDIQGNVGWGDANLPDSLKKSIDATVSLRYDLPVAKVYYLQTKAKGIYSSVTRDLRYEYEFSLGYIADGNVRVAAIYRQGYQQVTYQFDRKLLLGLAFDILNESASK